MAVTGCSSVISNGDGSFYHSNGMKGCKFEVRRSRVNSVVVVLAASSAVRNSQADSYHMKEVKMARQKFTQEVSFAKKDKDVSLSRALLYIAAEDETILSFHRDSDARSFLNELGRSEIGGEPELRSDDPEVLSFDGKSVFEWLDELDCIVSEVEVEVVSRDVDCHLVQVLEAVNKILFKSRHFKRYPVLLDTKFSYLHSALSSGCSSAIVLSVIYIEVCRKLGIEMVGSRVGEDFLIWPKAQSLEELFEVSSGPSLFAVMNGRCVEDPRAKAYELSSKSLAGLEVATNRDIIGIALANLIRLYWKRASRMNRGLMLTSPLRPVSNVTADNRNVSTSKCPLLRPQELRLAIMASERLLILQPHNWALRRDHGMLLYYSRKYGEAVQELSICMAFAPMEEAEVLEPFVEKLHLMRIESSWNMLENSSLAVP